MNIQKFRKDILDIINEYCSNMLISGNINFVFLCGGEDNEVKKSQRTIFLEYFTKHNIDENIIFIKAEEFFKIRKLFAREKEDLLDLENFISTICDCILLFVESPGSIAELGAFANINNIVKKMLVVNDKCFENKESFVNDGPILKVNRLSKYGATIYSDYKFILEDVHKISDTLRNNKTKKFKIYSLSKLNSPMDYSSKITTIFLILGLLTPITKDEAMYFLIELGILNRKNKNDEFLFDLVLSLNHFKEFYPKGYIVPTKFYNRLMKEKVFSTKIHKYRAKIIQYYYKKDYERFNCLKKGVDING